MNFPKSVILLALFVLPVTSVYAQDTAPKWRNCANSLSELKADYENRISALEARLALAESTARSAERDAEEAFEIAEQTAIDQSAGTSAPNTFNPAIGAILVGGYANVDTGWDEIPGFQPGGEIGTGRLRLFCWRSRTQYQGEY